MDNNPNPHKSFFNSILFFIIFGLILTTASGLIRYFLAKKQANVQSINRLDTNQNTSPTKVPTVDGTENWKTYTNEEYGFSFKYPSDAQLSTSDENSRINITLGKMNIACGYDYNFTVIFQGEDLIKKNNINTYSFKISNKEAERNDINDRLEGCNSQISNIYVKNTLNPQINNLDIYINDNKQNKELTNQILSTFKFSDSNEEKVLGIQPTFCCFCPTKISASLIGQDGWMLYERGKDYSSFETQNCKNIQCASCPPLN